MSPLPTESVAKTKKTPGSNNAKHKALVDSAIESQREKAVKAFGQRKKGTLLRAPNGEPQDVIITDDAQSAEEENPQSEQLVDELLTLVKQTVNTSWETLNRQLSLGSEGLSALIDQDEAIKSKVRDIYTFICRKEHQTTETLAKSLEASMTLAHNLSATLLNITGSPSHLGPVISPPLPVSTNTSHQAPQPYPNGMSQLRSTPSANPTPIKPSMAKKVTSPRPAPVNPTQRGHPGRLIVEFKPKLPAERQVQGQAIRDKINSGLAFEDAPAWL